MGRLRVLILVPDLSSSSPIQGAVALAGYLHSRGVDVIVGNLEDRGSGTDFIQNELRSAGVESYCFDMPGWLGTLRFGKLKRYVRDMEFDVVLSFNFRSDTMNWLLGKSTVRVCSIRENYDAWARRLGWKGGLAGNLMLRIWNNVDGLMTLTQAMAEDLRTHGIIKTPIIVVPNFINTASMKRRSIVQPVQADTEDLLIGYFGQLENWKRVDVTLEALAGLMYEDGLVNWHYHIVGDGRERQYLEKLAYSLDLTDSVTFHGYIPQPWSLMDLADIHLLASESEGLPRSIMEAMALGKTCIVSNLPGMNELIEHGKTGYLVEPGDVDSMRLTLRDIITAQNLLPSEHVSRRIESNHDVPVCGEKVLVGLRNIAGISA